MTDTIFAVSSGSPPAAVSVIRISGPLAHDAGRSIAGTLPPSRTAAVRQLRVPDSGEVLDNALVLRFDGPRSSTGEDCAELHCHGGRAVIEAVLQTLSALPGLREARPGEFTRRAFENGRIDLTEAEGLADLIEAETESQRRAALMMANGALSRQISDWREALLALSARAEAAIDYVDEDSVDSDPSLAADCEVLGAELEKWLERPRAEPLMHGIKIVIAGPPNAGKSSLLNRISGFERAIVTDIPGTTRDHLDVKVSVRGLPIRLIDTAGLREARDPVERLGVDRAQAEIQCADILLWMGVPSEAPTHPRRVQLHAKADLESSGPPPSGAVSVSSTTGQGIDELLDGILEIGRTLITADGEIALNRRQAGELNDASSALKAAAAGVDLVLQAEALRVARSAFDRLTGRAAVDDLLDTMFSRFCLGK